MTDNFWTSWGIVGSLTTPETYTNVMRVPGIAHDKKRGIPIFDGTLDEFSEHYDGEFTVYKDGRYIKVGNGRMYD